MKKTLLFAGFACALGASAQNIATFDDLTLTAGTYYNGSDEAGSFTSGGVNFGNSYNSAWSSWTGWAYSNTTDVTTAGFGNQYSAYAGGGADGSANYAVNYSGNIAFSSPRVVESIDITNTTFAALAMLNGDAYTKQFGSVNGPDGNPDGTNGADFFRVLIIGMDADSVAVDTVVFYLADYRFSNNTEDYIVDSWETVDLSSLGAIKYLNFALESSDNGDWGMNTPAYFAMDNLKYGNLSTEAQTVSELNFFPNPAANQFVAKGAEGAMTVTNATGAVVFEGVVSIVDCAQWPAGYYLITVTSNAGISRGTLVKQ